MTTLNSRLKSVRTAIAALAPPALRRMLWTGGATSSDTAPPAPPNLRPDADPAKARRAINRYLKTTGWHLEEPWIWADIRIRASKDGRTLNMLLIDKRFATWTTTIKDIQELSIQHNEIIGIITLGEPPPDAKKLSEEMGSFVMSLKELDKADEILNDAHRRREERMQKVSEANASRSLPTAG